MLSSGCDDRECRVLLHEGVRIGERATYALRESGWSCSATIPPRCLTSGILLRRHSTRMSHIWHTPSPNISHPAPDAGWERKTFQLLRSNISRSSDSAYPESFSLSIQCRGVLLKLPNRYFEIFCFRYLMSKSSNSPCNPPIIGFLSL